MKLWTKTPIQKIAAVREQHSALAAPRNESFWSSGVAPDSSTTIKQHTASARFMIFIEEANRKAEDEIFQLANKPVNKEK